MPTETIALNESGISVEEMQLISQLKENVKDILPQWILKKSEEDQNLYFVRWIRARENNLEKATDMLQNHLKWRIERNADEALKQVPQPFFRENYPYYMAGVDKKRQPVLCLPLSEWDLRKVVSDATRLAAFDNFVVHCFETFIWAVETEHNKRATGQLPITQMTILLDAKNYPYGQLIKYSAIKKIMQLAGVYEAHYPEILYKVVFVNCPSYFGMFMNLIKSVLPPKTMGKLHCHSSFNKWKSEIGDIVDPSIIPERYGGTLKIVQ